MRERDAEQRLRTAIAVIDDLLRVQLDEIIRSPTFAQLKQTWWGLHLLVSARQADPLLTIRIVHVTKRELLDDFARHEEFRQSWLIRNVYEREFEVVGGEPYGVLIGNYAFNVGDRDDVSLLEEIASVAAFAHAPFVASASPEMFGVTAPHDLPRVLPDAFRGPRYGRWNALRDGDDSRFLCLTVPLVPAHDCWMNGAWVVGILAARTFSTDHWWPRLGGISEGDWVDVRGRPAEDGAIASTAGGRAIDTPLPDDRLVDLSRQGFLPLIEDVNTGRVAAPCTSTAHRPAVHDLAEATADAKIWATLPCVLSASRVVHYLRIMCRDLMIGAYMETPAVDAWMNRWVAHFVATTERGEAEYPLLEARVTFQRNVDDYSAHKLILHLRPRLDGVALARPLRLVAQLSARWL